MQILKITLLCVLFIIPIHLICQVDQILDKDSANTSPVYQLSKNVCITWPLRGFVFKRKGIFYQNIKLDYGTLFNITKLEPELNKKQNLNWYLLTAQEKQFTANVLYVTSALLVYVSFGMLAVGLGTGDQNAYKIGAIGLATGTTGFVFAGIFNKKKRKANQVIVDLLNN